MLDRSDCTPSPRVRRHRVGLAEVRASFRAREREPICLGWFARPLANLVTPVFYNAGVTADQAIALRATCNAFALILLAVGGYWVSVAALCIYAIAYVLDCVDGNLSRLSGQGNYWGKFVDGLVDDMLLFLAPAAAGLGLWFSEASSAGLAIGGAVSTVALITGSTRHRYSFVREWMTASTGPLTETEVLRLTRYQRGAAPVARLTSNMYCFAPWLIALPNGVWWYLLAMLVITTPANLYWLALMVFQAHGVFRRPRRAAHEGVPVGGSPAAAGRASMSSEQEKNGNGGLP
jgi:phosphatidylglycerophosphate synthase